MSDLLFALHIFSFITAISISYAILMSILKKDVSVKWLKWEGILALFFTSLTLAFLGEVLFSGDNLYSLVGVALVASLGCTLALVVMHHRKVRDVAYPTDLQPTTRTLGIALFALLVSGFLIELAALSRGLY